MLHRFRYRPHHGARRKDMTKTNDVDRAPVHAMVIQPNDTLRVFSGCLSVNGKPFVVEHPDEPLESIDEDGKLVTRFRGHLRNHWDRSDIKGYWA